MNPYLEIIKAVTQVVVFVLLLVGMTFSFPLVGVGLYKRLESWKVPPYILASVMMLCVLVWAGGVVCFCFCTVTWITKKS